MKEKKILEPIPELGMEWLNEEWDGEIKEEKRKPEDTANIKQKKSWNLWLVGERSWTIQHHALGPGYSRIQARRKRKRLTGG